jgi:hypothetical protein
MSEAILDFRLAICDLASACGPKVCPNGGSTSDELCGNSTGVCAPGQHVGFTL